MVCQYDTPNIVITFILTWFALCMLMTIYLDFFIGIVIFFSGIILSLTVLLLYNMYNEIKVKYTRFKQLEDYEADLLVRKLKGIGKSIR